MIIYYALVAFLLSVPLTYLAKRYALKQQLVDVPDSRRNHQVITPRGGGVGIVISYLMVLIVLQMTNNIDASLFYVMAIGGLLIALLGYLDDHVDISSSLRFGMQVLTAAVVIWLLPLPNSFHVVADIYVVGWALTAGVFISIIWLINVYNFMDGLDGIASIEVISVSLIMLLLLWSRGDLTNEAMLLLVLSASTLGFLVFNWPPASVFMGDVGSCFLGFIMGLMSLSLWTISDNSMWAWVILQGVFVIDTVVTLLRRVARKVKVFEAHSQHAFQQAFRRHGSVLKVLAASVTIKLIWLAPCAWLLMNAMLTPLLAMLIAFAPLIIIAYCYNAGLETNQSIT